MTVTATYAAHLAHDEDGLRLVVTRDIVAGVCGPFVSETFETGTPLETVAAFLVRYGFTAPAAWTPRSSWAGITLEAPLELNASAARLLG